MTIAARRTAALIAAAAALIAAFAVSAASQSPAPGHTTGDSQMFYHG